MAKPYGVLLDALIRWRRWLAAAALLGVVPCVCAATDPDQLLAQMDHAIWTARDGSPQEIYALAQAANGTLWIGSERGLVNFDGRTFSAFQSPPGEPRLPAEAVHALCVTRDDTLWVGFLHGGAAHLARGHITLYPTVETQSLGLVRNLTQAPDGSIWATSNQSLLVRFGEDRSWHIEPTPKPGSRVDGFLIDSSQTLWLPQGGLIYRRPLAQALYTSTGLPVGISMGFVEMRDGTIWLADVETETADGRIQHFDHSGHLLKRLIDRENTPRNILGMPDGSIILASQTNGLRRLHSGGRTVAHPGSNRPADVFTSTDGLTSNEEAVLLRDVDGNLWVGGRRGLDRFRIAKLVRFIPKSPQGNWRLCADSRGLWIAGTDNQLYRLLGGHVVSFLKIGDAYVLSCDSRGDAWFADHGGIWQVHENRLIHLPPIPQILPYSVQAIAATSDGRVYASAGDGPADGYWEYHDNKWAKMPLTGLLGKPGWSSYLDSRERLWIGHRDGRIVMPLEGRILPSNGRELGTVNVFLETSHGMLAGGTNGVAILHDDGLKMLEFADENLGRGVGGMTESISGDLWLNTVRGVVRVEASELDAAVAKPDYRINADLLTEGEFVGASKGIDLSADAARDEEGNLWFATLDGVMHIDPARWRTESRPPTVSIRSISVDQHPLRQTGIIDPRPHALEIRYFGVHLTAPEKVIYRYRLDGFDGDWQDVGHRTEAIYTRLPKGHYRFQVVAASSNNGPWTAPESSIEITVLPSFYETNWFLATCVGAGLVVLGWIFWARLRAITREVRARAEERADERIRIARELHDTLLQGVQGLLLTFHVAAQKLSKDDESKAMLESALSTADRIIIEGRNRVSGLRSEHLTDAELIASIENVSNDLHAGDARFMVTRSGTDAALRAHVANEIFFVAREALTNAFRHSFASHIQLDLIYGNRYFTLICKDDGRGFNPREIDQTGHWGIQGMAERMHKLGGEIRLRSSPHRGTDVIVRIPAYRAYPRTSRIMFYIRALSPAEYGDRGPPKASAGS